MTVNESKIFLQKEVLIVDNFEIKNGSAAHSSWTLYISALTANILLIPIGSTMVWSSTVIPKLMSNNTEINPLGRPITSLETSLIVSIPVLSALFGLIISSKAADIIGRRRCLFYSAIIILSCLTTIALAKHIYIYFICLFLKGIFGVCSLITIVVYNTEIADDKNRTWLSCCVSLGLPIGQLFGFFFGAIINSIMIFTFVETVPIFIYFILYSFTVESPMYLIQNNKRSLALNTLGKLRSYDDGKDIEKEYKSIEECSSNDFNKKMNFLDLFRSYESRKAFLISFFLIFTQQVSGVNTIFSYMGLIFIEAGSILSGNQVGIIAGLVNVTAVFLCIFIINRFGRRTLLLISSLFCSISLLMTGFYFFLKEIDSPIVGYIRWLPVLSITLFISSYGLGLGSIPTGYIGELYPNELRATGVSTALILAVFVTFSLDFGFPLIAKSVGMFFSLFLNSVLTFIGFVILYFSLPETRGKSFKEIQIMLQKKIFSLDP